MGGRYKPRYDPKADREWQAKVKHLDAELIGRALEHAGEFISKWTVCLKYGGAAKKDGKKAHQAEFHKRHHAVCEIGNMEFSVRLLGEALRARRYRKAVDQAKVILLTPLPLPAHYDQPRGKWEWPD